MKVVLLARACILSGFLIAAFNSCTEPGPLKLYEAAAKGAYPKLVANSEYGDKFINIQDQSAFDLSKYGFSVEFIDGEGGMRIFQYSITISYADSAGDNSTYPIHFRTYNGSSFTRSVKGNLGVANIEITAREAAGFLGIKYEDLEEGYKFQFAGKLYTYDNMVLSSANSSPSIRDLAYFDFDLPVVRN